MLNAIVLALVVALAAFVAFGDPIRIRRPRRPASWSEAARRWWPYPMLLVWTVDTITHRHLDRRILLGMCALLGAAIAFSLVRGLRLRRPTGSSATGGETAVAPGTAPQSAVATGSLDDVTTVAVVMPWLGDGVTTATVTAVLKVPGQVVRAGEAICEVSTGKVDTEIPAEVSGVVAAVLVRPPADLAVGEPILRIAPDPHRRPKAGGVGSEAG